jgi:predicted RNase H-like HicB family nuclease
MEMSKTVMRYTVVLGQTPNNWTAYAPDVEGCIATAPTREQVERKIRSALAFHFEGLREVGLPIPEPGTWTTVVEVDVGDSAGEAAPDTRPVVPVRPRARRAAQRGAAGGSAQ